MQERRGGFNDDKTSTLTARDSGRNKVQQQKFCRQT
jgi:hypothetical protein